MIPTVLFTITPNSLQALFPRWFVMWALLGSMKFRGVMVNLYFREHFQLFVRIYEFQSSQAFPISSMVADSYGCRAPTLLQGCAGKSLRLSEDLSLDIG